MAEDEPDCGALELDSLATAGVVADSELVEPSAVGALVVDGTGPGASLATLVSGPTGGGCPGDVGGRGVTNGGDDAGEVGAVTVIVVGVAVVVAAVVVGAMVGGTVVVCTTVVVGTGVVVGGAVVVASTVVLVSGIVVVVGGVVDSWHRIASVAMSNGST